MTDQVQRQILQRKSRIYSEIASWLSSNDCYNALEVLTCSIVECLKSRGRLYFCGNGGSYADACHIAAEFTGRFKRERPPLPAIALGSNTAALTAIANDYGYEYVFSRELQSLATGGDLLIAMSTSGSSHNIVECINIAASLNISCLLLSSLLADSSQLPCQPNIIKVPFTETDVIQESHMCLLHAACELSEEGFK